MTPRQKLYAKAREYHSRHLNPGVAWDQVGAEAWSKACRVFARQVSGMSASDAVRHLKTQQTKMLRRVRKSPVQSGWNLQVEMDIVSRIDELVKEVRA